jgi:MFS family permease
MLEGTRSGFFGGYLTNHYKELGFDLAIVGSAFALHQLSDSLGRGIGGLLVQRFGLGLMATLGSSIGLLALLWVPKVQSAGALLALSAVWGLCLSAVFPGLMTLSSRMAVEGREGRALTLTSMMVVPWIGIGGIGGGLLAKSHPELALDILTGSQFLALLMALSLIFRPERVPPAKQEFYPWTKLLIFLPAAFGQTFAPTMLGFLLFPFAKAINLSGGWIVAVVAAGALPLLALPLTGRFADRRNPQILMIFGLGLMGLAVLGIGQMPTLSTLFILAMLAGSGMACFMPGWNSFVVKLLPEGNRAAMWGTILAVEGLGNAMGPVAAGTLAKYFGIGTPFAVAGSVLMVLSVFYVLLAWRRKWNLFSR